MTIHRSGRSERKRGRTWKLIEAKLDRSYCELGTLDVTDLEELIFFTFIKEGRDLQGGLNSFVDRVTLALSVQSHEFTKARVDFPGFLLGKR